MKQYDEVRLHQWTERIISYIDKHKDDYDKTNCIKTMLKLNDLKNVLIGRSQMVGIGLEIKKKGSK